MLLTLGATDVRAAKSFYEAVFSATAADPGLDLHGVAGLAVRPVGELAAEARTDSAVPDYRGYVLTYIVDQPSSVRSLLDAAGRHGAKVLKPAKKAMFAGFSGVFQAPDGAVWKLASSERKDTGPAAATPVPSEIGVLLGVASTKASAAFYQAVGMTVDRDYGSKYIDFKPTATGSRLSLMDAKTLAKDAGVKEGGTGFRAATFVRAAASRAELDAFLSAAGAGGGRIVASGEHAGHLADPDGFLWKVTSV